jgi:hypothetical protein
MLLSSHRFAFAALFLFAVGLVTARAQQTIGELYATDASVKGSVILAGSGTSVLSGSSIQAGAQAATLKLDRGGNVLVCEGTKLTVNSSQNGRELLFSLNTGNLELNYSLGTEADTLLTPDLRLMLPGPGTVHVAVRVTPQGDTCVQSLPWNVAAITLSETMGDATYQVKPDEAVIFKAGHLNEASHSRQNCGCPKAVPVQVAQAPAAPTPAQPQPSQPQTAQTAAASLPKPTQAAAAEPSKANQTLAAATLPAPPPEQHLAVEAPFIFKGSDPLPDLAPNVAVLRLESNKVIQLEPTVLPPANAKKQQAKAANQTTQAANKQSRGFFSKIGSFFASIFH